MDVVNDGATATTVDRGTGLTGIADRAAARGGSAETIALPGGPLPPARRAPRAGARMIRVLLAEDQAMIRGALLALIGLESDMTVVADVERGDEVVGAARRTRPDVAVLDIDMPGIDGLTAAARAARRAARDAHPDPHRPRPARPPDARARGPRRRLHEKDAPSDELADAIRRVAKGQRFLDPDLVATALEIGTSPLTARETEVLRVAADGGTTEEIGRQVYLSPATVRNYLSSSISKLGARNRIDAIRIAREAGWL